MSQDDSVQTPMSLGSPMTAKRFMEIKALVRDSNPHGLRPLGDYIEAISSNALDQAETDYVPFTMHVNGERRVIGKARISGAFVVGYLDEIDGAELRDIVSKNDLNGVSFGFHVKSFKDDYPGARDVPLTEPNEETRLYSSGATEREVACVQHRSKSCNCSLKEITK